MSEQQKLLFIDRDGTLIVEPADKQIDNIDKLELVPGVINALSRLKKHRYKFVMVSNQDGLGTDSFPQENFTPPHELMLKIFRSQDIEFEDILICPHKPEENCQCRKPALGLVLEYLKAQKIDRENSYVIGDRETDLQLAHNMGITGLLLNHETDHPWPDITSQIIDKPRIALVKRKTNETDIMVKLNLDQPGTINIATGIDFFDHMLHQVIKHAGCSGEIAVVGDLEIDDHHTVEDTAIAVGEALKKALGDKVGIGRYGFVLPMDEAETTISIDLSGRSYCRFIAAFTREKIGGLSTELVGHFFHSLASSLGATIHVEITGENTHHMIESAFKALGRVLRESCQRDNEEYPSTKGVL